MRGLVRKLFERGLGARGYELKEIGSPPRGFDRCLSYAKSRGLAPRTIFDVGVGHGTPWLYDAFPDAKLVLFEPLSVFDQDVDAIKRKYGAIAHNVALAGKHGEAVLNFKAHHPTSSSLLPMDAVFAEFAERVQARHHFRPERVIVETLDRLNSYEPPYLLKVDVEGGEREVLEGARETLRQTDFLIMEISVMRRYSGEGSFAETIQFVESCGFQLFDIPSMAQTKDPAQLIYLDAAFVSKNSGLWPS